MLPSLHISQCKLKRHVHDAIPGTKAEIEALSPNALALPGFIAGPSSPAQKPHKSCSSPDQQTIKVLALLVSYRATTAGGRCFPAPVPAHDIWSNCLASRLAKVQSLCTPSSAVFLFSLSQPLCTFPRSHVAAFDSSGSTPCSHKPLHRYISTALDSVSPRTPPIRPSWF
jgi:hypothetical protein